MLKKVLRIVKLLMIISLSVIVLFFLLLEIIDQVGVAYSDRLYSPDGAFYAQVEESDGGATTGFISGVTITNAKSFFSGSSFLSGRTGNSKNVFGFNGSINSISIKWLSNRALKIAYTGCSTIYGQLQSWNGIKIIYEGECNLK